MKKHTPPRPALAGVAADEVLPLSEVRRRLGWGPRLAAEVQRQGLRTVLCGKRKYCLGTDVLSFFQSLAEQALRNRLVEFYLPLADQAAERLIRRLPNSCDADSVHQEIRLALLRLVETFDPFRRKEFPAYASKRLSGAGRCFLRKVGNIPRQMMRRQTACEADVQQLAQRTGRQPTQQEIDDEGLFAPPAPVIVSLETVLAGSHGKTFLIADTLTHCCRRGRDRRELSTAEYFAYLLRGLEANTYTATYLYFAKGRREWEIAAVLDLSESRVSQLLAAGVKTIRARNAKPPDPPRLPRPR